MDYLDFSHGKFRLVTANLDNKFDLINNNFF